MRRLMLLAALSAAGCAGLDADRRECPDAKASVRFRTAFTEGEDQFKRNLCKAIVQVRDWWGPTFTGSLTVTVQDGAGPSMALVPSWRGNRGEMLFRSVAIRRGTAVTVHEMVHVFAPNANRFLAEGLATYANNHLNGPPGYPNAGRDLHRSSLESLDRTDLQALDRIATPTRLQLPGRLTGRDAYIAAGSFARFLIERHGMAKFRKLYAMTPLVPGRRNAGDPGRWQQVYGRPLEALSAEWRDRLRRGG